MKAVTMRRLKALTYLQLGGGLMFFAGLAHGYIPVSFWNSLPAIGLGCMLAGMLATTTVFIYLLLFGYVKNMTTEEGDRMSAFVLTLCVAGLVATVGGIYWLRNYTTFCSVVNAAAYNFCASR